MQTLAYVLCTWIHRFIGTYKKLNYICLTEFNKEKILQLKQIKDHQVFVKPNFTQSASKVVLQEERKNQCVYVGRLEEIKGVEVLLKAWKLLGEDAPTLLLCGKGPLEEWCQNYIEENQLSKVKILGFVANERVRDVIAESKALILPSQVYEGFPMTILEALSVGTPVIGSQFGNVGTLIKSHLNGLCFEAKSEKALARAVRELNIKNEDVYHYYTENYSIETNYITLKSIYEISIEKSLEKRKNSYA